MFLSLLKIISALIGIVGTTYLIPIFTALYSNETQVIPHFLIPMISSWIFTCAVYIPSRKYKIELPIKTTFVTVACAWLFTSLFGALPLWTSGAIPSFTDAAFESVSGFSTTGATILSDMEILPVSINMWRCMTHWLGGMGIVALTVALLPLLGVGGFQLIKAETTGPEKGKVTSKITTTAKILWIIYLCLTLVETILLKIFGMSFIDALMHSFSTLGSGGFSSRNNSIGSWNSPAIDIIITVFMFLAGINFSMYFFCATRKIEEIKENSELKAYLAIVFISIIAIAFFITKTYGSFATALRYSSFQTLAILSTTGFATADYTLWPSAAQFFIFLLFFIGGCSGSTGGGIKVIRWVILAKQIKNETNRMLHPHGIFSIRLNNKPGRNDIVFSVSSFLTLYFGLIFLTTFMGCIANLDILSAFTGAISMIGNVGPAFEKLGPSCNYGFLSPFLKWWYCFAMLAGRLELYTIIIFFMPSYWKK